MFPASDRQKRGKGKPETFTFLGFTHYCGRNSKGHFVVWRRTATKRMRARLQAIKQELRRKMHESVAQVGAWLKRVVDGYYRYHAVPGNLSVLGRFRERLCRYWRRILRRRSQRRKPDWEQLRPIFDRWLPRPRTLHPYPDVRFDARIQGRSRMRYVTSINMWRPAGNIHWINQVMVLDATEQYPLKRAQKRHQRRVLPPVPCWLACIGNFTLGQGLGFHLQIDFCVDVGRVERNMPEPDANGVDVHAGAEQVCGRGMSNGVGADPFCSQRGHLDLDFVGVPLDESVDAEACDGMPATIEEDTGCRGAVHDESFEFLNGTRPQRTLPLFAAFAANFHSTTRHIQFADEQLCGFLGASSGVVEKQQQCMVATALSGLTVGSAEERIHLRLVQRGDDCMAGLFKRDGTDLTTPDNVLRTALSDEASQSMNRRQALVASGNRTLTGLFQIGQEEAHEIR